MVISDDVDQTYFKLPDLRMMTSGYLNAGPALQLEAHRDTWYADPMCHVNWWIPLHDTTEDSVVAFHPQPFASGVRNRSGAYDLDAWRRLGAPDQNTRLETADADRSVVEELDPTASDDIHVLIPAAGILMFSGAHLHSTVANTSGRTRISFDFRTINARDIEQGRSAPNADSAPTGTTLDEFRRANDLAPMPAQLISAYRLPEPTLR